MKNFSSGFYLFSKVQSDQAALKEMLQFLRTQSPGKNLSFAYVESETSLHPHLTLWENLHLVTGGASWKEFLHLLQPEWQALAGLIQHPEKLASEAFAWERFSVSFIKAAFTEVPHVLVDLNEELIPYLNILNFKKSLNLLAEKRQVYLASANCSLWLDSAHSLIKRDGYKFAIEELNLPVKRRSA